MNTSRMLIPSVFIATALLTGCAKESSRSLQIKKVTTYNTHYSGSKNSISIGKFDNRSSYMNGIFSDGVDRLGNQSKTILMTHLQQTGRLNRMA